MIIGGGVIGALVAWRLKRMGAEPVIVERGDWGRESSWAGAGILAPIQPWLYPDAFTVLANASLALYPRFVAELEEASGMAVEWRTTGMLVPFFPGDADEAEAALRWSARAGWRAVRLSAHEARAEVPHLAADLMHAVLWPEVGQVRNPRLLAAAKKALLRLGVVVHEHTEAVALLRQGDAVCGVRTSDGEIAADAVVLAAGAWSGKLAQRWGLRLEVEPVKGEIVLLHGKSDDLRRIVKHADVYAVPRKDGRILIGATMQRVGFDRRTTE
ncbi:MAG: FAD-dependent oxidoreductase, partial [Zetaproteobacteria bacterium]